jgi:hypothetical protein
MADSPGNRSPTTAASTSSWHVGKHSAWPPGDIPAHWRTRVLGARPLDFQGRAADAACVLERGNDYGQAVGPPRIVKEPWAELLLALAFLVWCAFITFGAGFLGTILNCEYGCDGSGSVPWLKPWTLGSYYVFPEVFFIALAGFVSATLFAVALVYRHLIPSVAAFVTSLVLLAYPFFAGLTSQGQRLFWFGPFIGIAALAVSRRSGRTRARAHS